MMSEKEKSFLSAVIYVHNAEKKIGAFFDTILSVLEDNFEHSEIICVNDLSEDGSISLIKDASRKADTVSVTIVDMSFFHGVEVAMNAGVDLAIGDLVFEFDDTVLDFDSREIMNLYHRALQGYDIVSAIPDKKEKLTSRLFYKVFDGLTGSAYGMHTERFRILSRRAINRVRSVNRIVPYRKVIYARLGLKRGSVIYQIKEAQDILIDKKERAYRLDLAIDSLILFTGVGYRFSITMTILMMMMSIFMVVYSTLVYMTAHPVAGWTTTVLFLSVAFFGLFGIFTVIIKYLQLIVDLIFKRKPYSFKNIEKLM